MDAPIFKKLFDAVIGVFITRDDIPGDELAYVLNIPFLVLEKPHLKYITYFVFSYCVMTVIAMNTFFVKHFTLKHFVQFSTAFFLFHMSLVLGGTSMVQRKYYRELQARIHKQFWRRKIASKMAFEEINSVYLMINWNVIIIFIFAILCIMALQPYALLIDTIDFETTMHFFLYILYQSDIPKFLINSLIVLNYSLIFWIGFIMIGNLFTITYFTAHFKIQFILLGDQIIRIGETYKNYSTEALLDNEKYQEFVRRKLCACIIHHTRLVGWAKEFTKSMKNIFLLHLFGAIATQGSLLFILLLFHGLSNPVSCFLILATSFALALSYIHCGVEILDYNPRTFDSLMNTRWDSWSASNRKILWIFMKNCEEIVELRACFFTVNYQLFIWILHKIGNIYSALLFINPEAIQL